jgi:hypothetical protein
VVTVRIDLSGTGWNEAYDAACDAVGLLDEWLEGFLAHRNQFDADLFRQALVNTLARMIQDDMEQEVGK